MTEQRLHQLMRQPAASATGPFEITFLEPGGAGLRLHLRLGIR